ncbi:shiftless antiviral inhibitor of ribosomal frameshifting protein-like isoform X1 [Lethenteron reissneri]|uniref:shiftless antiviral inhibitor of ribosomal frameshifting protein-like isoform X2 n=2 Tax=Lethenteron reissneri TaxID=7753 RepID=UPI002AB68BE6|nr:shiftless antiviral inhibitor of ribosomal frameshifting protein-like isoform X2 [Lethenteron reissneri]XP_061436378.1 shiftless antiviral inhibitor of ribosomal frameshifting protein-like isoform X1 [Lethenteron reissneri]
MARAAPRRRHEHIPAEEIMMEKSIRRLREKVHGKVSIEKAAALMLRFQMQYESVAKYIVLAMDREDLQMNERDRQLLNNPSIQNIMRRIRMNVPLPPEPRQRDPMQDFDVQAAANGLRVLELTEQNLNMFENLANNELPHDDCQFACSVCDSVWWRRVPQRKMVSQCRRCKRKYQPVPRDREWGSGALFNCTNCNNTFSGWGQMGVPSPCYQCQVGVCPTRVQRPKTHSAARPSGQQHSCMAEDCYNRQGPGVTGTHCVHPRTLQVRRRRRVLHASEPHISTASTVATCISQGSLVEHEDVLIEQDLLEEDENRHH